jgi:hypothetical protein
VAAGVLFVIFLGLSAFLHPSGYLGTDTGGKVATLRAMARHHSLNPDLGYWAARWDPSGLFHPLYYTTHSGGKWVNVTTVSALDIEFPLYLLAGYRGALLISMAGAVLTALAARALARRLGAGDGAGWVAFWLVGLASPVTIYALDIWEHSVGLALMAWGSVFLLDAWVGPGRKDRVRGAGLAGLCFGAAATMRTEALAYAAVLTLVVCIWLLIASRSVVPPLLVGAVMTLALAVPVLAGTALDRAQLGTSLRAARATSTVQASGSEGKVRLKEAALTSVGLEPSFSASGEIGGLLVAALLALGVHRARRTVDARFAVLALAGAGVAYLLRIADGLGFVSGLTAAAPLTVVGLTFGWARPLARPLLLCAGLTLPVVWATDFLGGAGPQWGGRYILLSGFLLGVVGIAALGATARWAAIVVAGLAVVVTAFGMVWMLVRTHQMAHAQAALARRPEAVLVSEVPHLAREGGAFAGLVEDRRWLTLSDPKFLPSALDVVRNAGLRTFALVQLRGQELPGPLSGWTRIGSQRLTLFDSGDLVVTTYDATAT